MPVEIFCCYARKDQQLLHNLKAHLMPLQRQGLITLWSDININAGKEWEEEIIKHLNTAQVILLLVSPDFMDSDYCYSNEMKRALERHKQGDVTVIPIILRWVRWQGTPLGELQALPRDGKPVKSWQDEDEAFYSVTEGIYKAVQELILKSSPFLQLSPIQMVAQIVPPESVSIIKPEQFALLRTIEVGSEAEVLWPAFSPDGQLLTVGSTDGKIRLWGKK